MNVCVPVNLAHTSVGSGDYASYVGLLEALGRRLDPATLHVYCNAPPADFAARLGAAGHRCRHLPLPPRLRDHLHYWPWLNFRFPAAARRHRDAVGLFLDQKMPLAWRGPAVVRVQDLAYRMFPDHFRCRDRLRLRLDTGVAVRRAHRIVAISETTKNDILRYHDIDPARIVVAPNGVDRRFHPDLAPATVEDVLRRHRLGRPYILHVGVLQRRKNLHRLLQAFDRFLDRYHTDHTLVLAGPRGWLFEDIFAAHRDMHHAQAVRFLGLVPAADLPALYHGADLFVMPSLYEGFGIPLAEAMACGTPAAAARTPSLEEVGGDGVLYFDPLDPEAMAATMARLLDDHDLRQRCRARALQRVRRFTWDRAAAIIAATLEEVAP